MENYKNTIKKRMVLCCFFAGLCAAVGILDQSGLLDKTSFFKHYQDVADFQIGLVIGLGTLAIIGLFKYSQAIKDETKLKLLFNKEHDERQKLIRQKAGMPMLMITSGMMIFAAIIAGYIDETVFYTLMLAAIAQLTMGVVVKLYYMKKI